MKKLERTVNIVFILCAAVSILALALISGFLAANGVPAIAKIGPAAFLAGKEWSPSDVPPFFGILPMIAGSFLITGGAVIMGVPIAVLCAVFLARVCPKKLYRVLKPGVDLLAGIPSVVYGFFGMTALVPLTGNSVLSASILLGVMILPTVIGISESALRAVTNEYYEGALALGADHYRAVYGAVLPAAKSGILAAAVLGLGRAVGETMAVVMVAGNQARMPVSLFKGARTLTANVVIEMGYAEGLHREALIATGFTLFVLILMVNIGFRLLTAERKK